MKAKVKRAAAVAPSARAGIPTLEALLGSILDRLPPEALKSIAGMPPLDEAERETFEGRVVELAQALAADRVCGVDHTPNAATRKAIRDLEEGRDVTRHANMADALAAVYRPHERRGGSAGRPAGSCEVGGAGSGIRAGCRRRR